MFFNDLIIVKNQKTQNIYKNEMKHYCFFA